MDSKTADDNGQTANETPHVNGINGHTNGHSRQNSQGSDKDMELEVSTSSDRSSVGGYDKLNLGSSKDVETPGKNNIGAYEKLKGIFRSRSSANSKTNSTPQIKVSMHPEGQDAKMSQKALRATKLTLDSQEGDGESDTDFEVPSDGNLYSYSVDNMMQFFKYLHFDDKIIKSLQRRKVDGRRFSKMTNEDLKKYGIDNPIVVYFRSKSEKKREASNLFML